MSGRSRGADEARKSSETIGAWKRLARLLACLTVVAVSGAQTSCGPEPHDSESPGATETQSVARPFTLSFTLPGGVEPSSMAVAAKLSLNARDRTQIMGPMGTSSGPLTVDNDAKVRALTARGNVTIRDRSVVTGNVRATGSVTRSPSATVNGTVQGNASIASRTIQWTFQADDVSSGDVVLAPDERRDLPPGSYGTVSVGSRAKLEVFAPSHDGRCQRVGRPNGPRRMEARGGARGERRRDGALARPPDPLSDLG